MSVEFAFLKVHMDMPSTYVQKAASPGIQAGSARSPETQDEPSMVESDRLGKQEKKLMGAQGKNHAWSNVHSL